MTISVDTPRSGPYSGDGSTVAFSYTFLIDDEAEVVVVVSDGGGNETIQTLTTDYTVSGVGSASGGTVTFVTAPAATETVAMYRATDQAQGTDFVNRGSVQPEVIETALDEAVKMVQDLQEQIDRAPLLPITEGLTGVQLPRPVAGYVVGWNGAATDLEAQAPNTAGYLSLPASSTDNALPRWNGAAGTSFQDSGVIVDDNNNVTVGSNLYLDEANSRIGIGTQSPAKNLHISDATPTIRLEDEGLAGHTDIWTDGASLAIDIDPGAADASSELSVAVDGSELLRLDGSGVTLGGATAPDRALRLSGTDALKLPVGTTGQRPGTPTVGDLRWNSSLSQLEFYDGSNWGALFSEQLGGTFAAGVEVSHASNNLGEKTTGTVTLSFADGPIQRYTNGGAHTLAAPSSGEGSILVEITNNASAGAITTSGFDKETGDSFDTTNGNVFRCNVSRINGKELLQIVAMQ